MLTTADTRAELPSEPIFLSLQYLAGWNTVQLAIGFRGGNGDHSLLSIYARATGTGRESTLVNLKSWSLGRFDRGDCGIGLDFNTLSAVQICPHKNPKRLTVSKS
jgi:hypothetical protein